MMMIPSMLPIGVAGLTRCVSHGGWTMSQWAVTVLLVGSTRYISVAGFQTKVTVASVVITRPAAVPSSFCVEVIIPENRGCASM